MRYTAAAFIWPTLEGCDAAWRESPQLILAFKSVNKLICIGKSFDGGAVRRLDRHPFTSCRLHQSLAARAVHTTNSRGEEEYSAPRGGNQQNCYSPSINIRLPTAN